MGIFRRIPARLPVAYAAVMVLILVLMLDFRSLVPGWVAGSDSTQMEPTPMESSVPAMAAAPGGQRGQSGQSGQSGLLPTALTMFQSPGADLIPRMLSMVRLWFPETEFLKSVLADGVPLMSMLEKPSRPREPVPAWRRVAETLGYYVSGIDAGDPLAVLATQIPILVLNPSGGIAEVEKESDHSSFDPIGWFWGPRRRDPTSGTWTGPPMVLGQGPVVAFYNTHAYESYLSEMSSRPVFLGDIATWNNERNVVRVAQEMARTLFERYQIPTVHSPAHHNQEGQALSYKHSRLTAQKMLKEFPTVRILADIHRDSAERPETLVEIKGQKYARVMLVVAMGDPESGLAQPNAVKSLAFANELFRIMEQKYPGLGRPVLPKKARYNQDLIPGAILIEVGGPENSLDEALNSARAMADVLAEAIRIDRIP